MIKKQYMVEEEPYYNYFISRGYKFLSSGYMHAVFEKDGYVFKVVKSSFKNFDQIANYLLEQKSMLILLKHNFPVADVVSVYDKGAFLDDFCVLQESKINGNIKNSRELTPSEMMEIYNLIVAVTKITLDYYGPLNANDSKSYGSWSEYLEVLIDRAKRVIEIYNLNIDLSAIENFFKKNYIYNGMPCYLILDPNEKNFIFNEHGNITGIIDIDHPIGGDPLYQWSLFMYFRPLFYEFLINNNLVNQDQIKIIEFYGVIFSLNDIMFRSGAEKIDIESLNYYLNKSLLLYENVVRRIK